MSADNSHNDEMKQEVFRLILYIRGQINEGKTNDQIVNDLVTKGMPPEQAKMHVEMTREQQDAFRRKIKEQIIVTPDKRADVEQIHGLIGEYSKRIVAAQRGWKRMWTGLLWLVLGSCITLGTYSTAASSPYGGSYTICYGAIALGAIYFLWGLFEWLANR